ncbi:MAG: hypothetical protein QNJ37_18655 [Crocosphaera sp.]|nr:hypothetical protein [Crocosphaera sp.]
MKTINLINKLGTIAFISLGLVLMIDPVSYSQRPLPPSTTRSLISRDNCTSDGGRFYYGTGKLVSIGRQPVEYIAKMDANKGQTIVMSCRIVRSKNYNPSTLTLKFGILDGEHDYRDNTIKVNFYLDGQFKSFRPIIRGQLTTVPLDIKNMNSVAIEVEYSDQASSTHDFYIVDASLLLGTIEENDIYVSSPNDTPNGIIIESTVGESPSLTPDEVINDTHNVIKEIDGLRQQVEGILKVF